MRFLIDTCVVSEWKRRQPDPSVLAWLGALEYGDVWFSILIVGELARGIRRLPACRRRDDLQLWLQDLEAQYGPQILPVSRPEVRAWAEISATAEAAGAIVGAVDGLIAATARVHDLVVATRNTQDFAPTGVPLFDPWAGVWHNR